jgi:hypothetical protein
MEGLGVMLGSGVDVAVLAAVSAADAVGELIGLAEGAAPLHAHSNIARQIGTYPGFFMNRLLHRGYYHNSFSNI